MFKVGVLDNVSDISTEIFVSEKELKNYIEKTHYHYSCLDLCISGKINENEYSLCFRLDKQPIDKLCEIELNTCEPIEKYIDEYDVQLGVNGIFDMDVKIYGNIYRIISNTIIISGAFISSVNEIGKFEIEFNLDDYINKDEKSDI